MSKINIRVGDQIQWYKSTALHTITSIDGDKAYYNYTNKNSVIPSWDYLNTIEREIKSGNMFKYIPVKQKQKVQPKLKTENRVVRVNAVRDILKKSNGQIFTVAFRKRTNGEIRIMNARLGVQKRLTGKGMSYNPKNRGLMTVFDMQKQEYRMIDIRTVIWLKVNGTMYTVS